MDFETFKHFERDRQPIMLSSFASVEPTRPIGLSLLETRPKWCEEQDFTKNRAYIARIPPQVHKKKRKRKWSQSRFIDFPSKVGNTH